MVGVTEGVMEMVGVGVTAHSGNWGAGKLLPHILYGPFTVMSAGMPPVSWLLCSSSTLQVKRKAQARK